MKLSEVVKFRGDLLFNGAVRIDWFESSPDLRDEAVKHFLFHGPEYHGVSQSDVTTIEEHALIDTASFALETLEAVNNRDSKDNPFALAIAGYGTGKSHFGLTLSCLLDDPKGKTSTTILNNIHSAAPDISQKIRDIINESKQPYLVIAINGMDNFDLAKELTAQILARLREHGIDTKEIEKLRPRFQAALGILNVISDSVSVELTNSLGLTKDQIENSLNEQDEGIFEQVSSFFEQRNMPITAVGRESMQELIDVTCANYCGSNKPFRALVIVFDEFGRYMEFATLKSQIAGSGVLQQLFEGIQNNSENAFFLGLIQFELNSYLDRIAPEFKNDIIRVVTRYQTSRRYFLSVNLETIIANVIEKHNNGFLDDIFSSINRQENTEKWISRLKKWFPQVQRYSLWCDKVKFQKVIQQGCWPLDPMATWFLYHLTSGGRYLQQRSALSILRRTFDSLEDLDIPEDSDWSLSATKLWSNELQEEFLSAEEYGKQGGVAHAYATVYERYSNHLEQSMIESLRAIVLASKMGMSVSSRDEAIEALSIISGLPKDGISWAIQELQSEYNIIEWDDSFKQFEIIGDAVSRTQFTAFLRSRVGDYDSKRKAEIFSSKAREWSKLFQDNLLQDIDTGFGEEHDITTKEWRFESRCSNIELLQSHIYYAVERWIKAYGVDEPRGHLIYCYVSQESSIDNIKMLATTYLQGALGRYEVSYAPILIVLLHDIDDKLGQAMAKYTALADMNDEERSRFSNFIMGHTQKSLDSMQNQIKNMISEQNYISCWSDEQLGKNVKESTTNIFDRIYSTPIPFPFDGFSTVRGNAADDCQMFIRELFLGNLDHNWYTSQPPKTRNRANSILNNHWIAISQSGSISLKPGEPFIREIIDNIDSELEENESINLGNLVREYCGPPYGGNIASVGLILGVFVSARRESLIVEYADQEMNFDNWLQNNEVFSGKYLNLDTLIKTSIRSLPPGVEDEWKRLFSEWEQAESHKEKVDFIDRASELRSRRIFPPNLFREYELLKSLSQASEDAISNMENREDEEINKLENGKDRGDVANIAWAGSELLKLQTKMREESPLWLPEQINSLDQHIDEARQAIAESFDDWLSRQGPKTLEEAGKFRHKMIDLVCGNLELLQLHEYAERVKDRTQELVKHSDDMIELNRLAMSIRNWIDACSSLSETTKVKTLDGYIKTADEYKNQLQDIKKRIVNIKQIDETKQVLDSFKKKCEKLKGDHKKRVSDIYKRIREIIGYNGIENISQEIEKISQELDVLFSIFEGTIDEEDLLDNKHIATSFAKDIKLLSNLQLSKYEFENCYNNLRKKCIELFGERETQWPIEELYGNIYNAISSLREEEGKRWLDGLNDQISELDSMSKEDLRIILSHLDSFPPFLEDEQTQKAHEIKRKIEYHLNKLDLEWLIEHFKELSPDIKKDFYIKIQSIMNNYIDSDWLFDCFKKLPPDIQKEFCIRIQTECRNVINNS